jgi:hypothetical protein
VARKEVIGTILGQFRRLFVSAANAGLKVLVFSINERKEAAAINGKAAGVTKMELLL